MSSGNLHQLQLTIRGAVIQSSPRIVANVYVEVIVDGKRGRKTNVITGTLCPVWEEPFDILVRTDTVFVFQVYHRSKWRSDIMLGQAIVCLGVILSHNRGQLQNTSVKLDLFDIKGVRQKVGELSVFFSGMTISLTELWNSNSSRGNTTLTPLISSSSAPNLPLALCSNRHPAHGTTAAPSPVNVMLVNYPTSSTRFPSFQEPVSTVSASAGVPCIHSDDGVPLPVIRVMPCRVTPNVQANSIVPSVNHALLPTTYQAFPAAVPNASPPTSSPVTSQSNLLVFNNAASGASSSDPLPAPLFIPPSVPLHISSTGPSPSLMVFDTLPAPTPSALPPDQLADVGQLISDLPVFTGSGAATSRLGLFSASSPLIDFGFEELEMAGAEQSFYQSSASLLDGAENMTSEDDAGPLQSSRTEMLHDSSNAPLPDESYQNVADRNSLSEEINVDNPGSDSLSSRESSVSPSGDHLDYAPLPHFTSNQQLPSETYHDNDALPPGWERRVDQYHRVYYVDHNTQTTTWIRPSPNLINQMHTFELGRHDRGSQLADIATRFLPNALFGEGNEALGRLPDGWERRINNRGMPYFYNSSTDTTLLDDPRIHSLLREDPLPEGWEMRVSDGGVIYFTNHQTKEQTYRDPRGKELKCVTKFGVPYPHERSFSWKLRYFRELCASSAVEGHIKIHISRENIFQDSFTQILRIPVTDLKRRMHIIFRGEDGLDYGGVAREWFLLLSLEILHPMLGLFQYINDRNCTMQISAASYVDPRHLEYFQFIGRFIALALFHGMFIGSSFCLPFYKKILNKRLTLKDIESIDAEVYNSLKWIRDTDLNEDKMPEMYFASDFEVLGRVEHHELKPGGSNIMVTEENKSEYIILMIDWMFSRGIEKQTQAFLSGFNEVIPLKWLQYFDEMELELMLCGMQEIDVSDWQKNSVYKHYSRTSKQILWFWKFVQELCNEDKMRLLQFVTGTCRLPVGGFAQLMGSTGLQKFCIEKVGKVGSLPRSHTCFNRLDLPPYKSYEQLSEKLKFAIHETEGFGLE